MINYNDLINRVPTLTLAHLVSQLGWEKMNGLAEAVCVGVQTLDDGNENIIDNPHNLQSNHDHVEYWWQLINVDKLVMNFATLHADGCGCVLSQLYRDYSVGLDALNILPYTSQEPIDNRAGRWGFEFRYNDANPDIQYDALKALWTAAIDMKREGEAADNEVADNGVDVNVSS